MDQKPDDQQEKNSLNEREMFDKLQQLTREALPVDTVVLLEVKARVITAWQRGDREVAVREMDIYRDMLRNVVLSLIPEQSQIGDIALNLSVALVWLESGRIDKFLEDLEDVSMQAEYSELLSDKDIDLIIAVRDYFYEQSIVEQ